MTEDSGDDRTWLLEPVEADRVLIHVRIGDDVELDDDQRRALEELVQAFHERDEVEGFAMLSCKPQKCGTYGPCAAKTSCTDYSCSVQRSLGTFGTFGT